jgi:glucosylceramidase
MNKLIALSVLLLTLTAMKKGDKKATKGRQHSEKPTKVVVYTTAEKTNYRLTPTDTLQFKPMGQPFETDICVFVDPSKKFQQVTGFGGALTDASAETFYKLPQAAQKELIEAYYDNNKGIGYNMARTNINSCDFSSSSYTYVEDNDSTLSTFNISHDKDYKIPLIKEAIKAANNKLQLFVSPWSPPAWMKENNSMLQGGRLKDASRQSWANYYVKFIKAYEAEGIPVWGLSVQNEPMAKQRWESCIYTGDDERNFVKSYLGPTLQRNGLSNKKLIIWDHNRDLIYQRASAVLDDPEAAKYVWGIGYHWYETWTGSGMQFQNMQKVTEAFPGKKLLFTEGCVESFDYKKLYEWRLGERYGHSMINDFNNGTVAFTDWNILLDENGGPNHVGNFCFAPVHANLSTGKLIYTNSYFYIGHFSKFVHKGARRITCSTNRDKLEATAFVNPGGKISVIVMNSSDDTISYHLWIHGDAAEIQSLPHSIVTLVVE